MPPDNTEAPGDSSLERSLSPTESDNPSGSVEIDLLAQVAAAYKREDLEDEFRAEENAYKALLPLLASEIAPTYTLDKVLRIGSTACVFLVRDERLGQDRVLKLCRPRLSRLRDIIQVIRGERSTLAALNHQNIIKTYTFGEVEMKIGGDPYEFPYFVMEYLPGVVDLREYLEGASGASATEILEHIHGILSGLRYLHEVGIVHCDIKPGNILIPHGRPALLTDFGYSKHLFRQSGRPDMTDVTFTIQYAHPELVKRIRDSSDPDAARAQIPRKDLRAAYDLYALGRTFLELLASLCKDGAAGAAFHEDESELGPSEYETIYLSIVAKRLLDGRVDKLEEDELLSDFIPGLPNQIMEELRYETAYDALRDIEKLLRLYDLEGEIPELRPELPDYVQIPHCHVPMTSRVRAIVNHPTFARLARVTQLGFVSLVYPGATHTRFEHVLGAFSHCCRYIRALWYDEKNCLVRCLLTRHDLEVALVAALVHDIAQFPMAHDLAEASSDFTHETFTSTVLEEKGSWGVESLAAVIWREWGVSPAELLQVLDSGDGSSFRARVLKSIISGPLDCDKLDYLKRDSTHLGVAFGTAIDDERLIRNLTLAYRQSDARQRVADGPAQFVIESVGVGVSEKALTVGESIWRARKQMFTQVYWHHTIRALKAMLGFVVRNTLRGLGGRPEEFWDRFHEGLLWMRTIPPILAVTESGAGIATATRSGVNDDYWPDDRFEDVPGIAPGSQLAVTDDMALLLFREFGDARVQEMVDRIRKRDVFVRHTVISSDRHPDVYDAIYGRFRAYRLDGNVERIEKLREEWEEEIRSRALVYLENRSEREQRNADLVEAISLISGASPLVLVDIPVKATSHGDRREGLLFLPEGNREERGPDLVAFPRFDLSQTVLSDEEFDKSVGKIRVLVPGEVRKWVSLAVSPDEVRKILH